MLVGGPELPQKQPAEQTREHAHWQKEALPVAGHFQLSRLLALPKLIEQGPRFLHVGGVEPFGEPAIQWR
jgi:hypothetical protein